MGVAVLVGFGLEPQGSMIGEIEVSVLAPNLLLALLIGAQCLRLGASLVASYFIDLHFLDLYLGSTYT